MTTMNPTDEMGAELSAQTASLRRLARDLVGDPHLAEDVVQDAMRAAIEQPPRARNALVAWLRTVVRRGAFDLRRTERRRREGSATRTSVRASPRLKVEMHGDGSV